MASSPLTPNVAAIPRRTVSINKPTDIFVSGQLTGIDTNPAPLTEEDIPCQEVLVQADPGNDDILRIGSADGQYVALDAGQSYSRPVTNVNQIYVVADSGTQTANWDAR